MAKHPMVSNYDLSSVTDIVTAAAPVSPEVCVELQERLNLENFCIRQGKTLRLTKYGHMGQVAEVRLSCYLVLLSFDSKTR